MKKVASKIDISKMDDTAIASLMHRLKFTFTGMPKAERKKILSQIRARDDARANAGQTAAS